MTNHGRELGNFRFRDLLQPGILADPYPLFRQLRIEAPVHEDPGGDGWIISRYQDVAAVLGDPRFSAARLLPREDSARPSSPIRAALARQMLFLDPPDHIRLRRLFAKPFSPGRLEAFRPHIREIVSELLDAGLRAGGGMDFIRDVAVPLPVAVIAEILGVPREDRHRLRDWSAAFGALISGRSLSEEEARDAGQGILAFVAYFERLIAARRQRPEADMLSDLVVVEEAGDRLTSSELVMNLILLLAAGHGTTTHLLGNGLLALLQHPAQWQRLVSDPSICPSAVTELLRFDAPVQTTSREALEDVELGGRIIPKGQRARVLLGSANRDERHFSDPDRLDLRRAGTRILSFGHGIHTCLGAVLARLEAQIAFTEIASRFPATRIEADALERIPSITFRGLRSLPIALS